MTTPEIEGAERLRREGRFSEAIRLLQGAERQGPEDREVLLHLASCYSAIGMPAMAVEYERRAANADPGSPQVWAMMGSDLLRLGDLPRSEGAYRRALDLDPGLAAAAYNLARVAAMRGDTTEAKGALKRAVDLQPDLAAKARRDGSLAKLLEGAEFRRGTAGRRRA